jgi:hypothetical protein
MIGKLDTVLHSFDKFGQPVANLNMKGTTQYKTRFGGLCGIAVYGLMAWFLVIRVQKMMDRQNPTIYEIRQGMNLMLDGSPSYNLAE